MDPIPVNNPETNLLTALIAGAAAGMVQTTVTFPFEFIKTTNQIQNLTLMKPFQLPMTIRPYFTGCIGLAMGNSLKAASRFLIFNHFSKFMANENGKTTAPRVVVAGIMTGFVETLWVIPFENIKTTMIQNSMILSHRHTTPEPVVEETKPKSSTLKTNKLHIGENATGAHKAGVRNTSSTQGVRSTNKPGVAEPAHAVSEVQAARAKAVKYYNQNPQTTLVNVLKEIYQTRGWKGLTQGSVITLFRQSANSMVWFSTYNTLQQWYSPNRTNDMSTFMLTCFSFLSSAAVVIVTQPVDLIKTRMQTKDYNLVYRDVMTCIVKTFMTEGFKQLYAGWLPRLVKVSCSGSITLVTYEAVEKTLNLSVKENPFQAT